MSEISLSKKISEDEYKVMKIIYHLPALTNIGMFKQASSMLYGIVTDPSGKPLANVKVKANNTETITDPNGVYTLKLSSGKKLLVFEDLERRFNGATKQLYV